MVSAMAFVLTTVRLSSNVFLSPLAGYTNLPFRLVIREIGGVGMCTTDLVNARSLLENNRKALKLIETCDADHPLAVQLYGSVAEEMRDAAQLLESLGADLVDVNMGCPVRKVCSSGGGSAMMAEPDRAVMLVTAMVNAVKIPVTCKMRLGWDDSHITAPGMARALEGVGVAAITIHGRTREQGFGGPVNLAGIRAVVQAVDRIPVVGNGDVTTPQSAKSMFDQTGCAAISIGRGAFYNPWIFQHSVHYLATGELLPEPGFEERITVMRRHLNLMVEVFGENVGCRMFRKVAMEYAKGFGPVAEFNRRIVTLSAQAELDSILAGYRAWRNRWIEQHGTLRPEFRAAGSGIAGIRVPGGPNELW
jgi:nifR3 family TIM-barrel protein